jgi:protein TonB
VDATDSSAYPPPPPPPPPPAVPVAPDEPAKESEVFFIVEKMPDFLYKDLNGINAFRAYVMDNIKYPKEAMDKGIQGKVYVAFVVEADGSISSLKIVRGVNKLLDEEALRAVKTAPKWTPGEQKGKKVRVSFTIPVTYKLQ